MIHQCLLPSCAQCWSLHHQTFKSSSARAYPSEVPYIAWSACALFLILHQVSRAHVQLH
uniref:Uncharacterized protein n=1 Tax=Arundo donax TaxID=35708 RepID=A0A0A8Y3K0_ARUDO